MADLYVKENDQLRAANADLARIVDELHIRVAGLENEREALLAHLRAAKGLATLLSPETDGITPDARAEDDEDLEPVDGENQVLQEEVFHS